MQYILNAKQICLFQRYSYPFPARNFLIYFEYSKGIRKYSKAFAFCTKIVFTLRSKHLDCLFSIAACIVHYFVEVFRFRLRWKMSAIIIFDFWYNDIWGFSYLYSECLFGLGQVDRLTTFIHKNVKNYIEIIILQTYLAISGFGRKKWVFFL